MNQFLAQNFEIVLYILPRAYFLQKKKKNRFPKYSVIL